MKKYILAAVLSVFALSACQTTQTASTNTEADAASEATEISVGFLVGRTVVADNGTVFVFNKDGTMGGEMGGKPIVGTYVIEGNEICSTYSEPANLAGRDFCSVPTMLGDRIIFVRRDGSKSQPYAIEG